MKLNAVSAFPKPREVRKKPEAVRVMKDGREVCNMLTKAGKDEYLLRIRQMWERQGKRCCLEGLVPECPGRLSIAEAQFEHEDGRGHGGGHRDDRIYVAGKAVNGACHAQCNIAKASRRIKYNRVLLDVP